MRQKIATIALCLLVLAMMVSFSGCSKHPGKIAAKVGSREINIDEISNFLDQAGARFPSATDELQVRLQLLDTLINQNLLIIGAYEKGLDKQEQILAAADKEKDKFLLNALFQEKIVAKAVVSEAEIKDWYNRMGEEIKVSHILVATDSAANDILKKLKEGATFEQLAVQYSTDPSAQRNQGDLGWISWGSTVDNFQDAAFKLKPGEVSAPVKTEFGYHIIKLVDRRKVENRPSYDEVKDQITSSISDRRKRALLQDYIEVIKKKYPVTVEKPTCQFVLNRLATIYPDTISGHPRWRNNIDPAQLNTDEKALILGSYPGGQMTLGEYLTNLQYLRQIRPPDFDSYDSLASVIFQLSFLDILTSEAKAEKMENSQAYKDNFLRFKEMAMADVMRSDSIPFPVKVDDSDAQEYYNIHQEEFVVPLRFHLLEILLADEKTAEKYKTTIRTEQEFKKIAASETLRFGKKDVSGDLGIVARQQSPQLFDAVANAKVGSIVGPIKIGNRFSILWIKERLESELQPFAQVKSTIVDILIKSKGDELYREWIENIRKRTEIKIDSAVVKASVDETKYARKDTTVSGE